jgi:hypothetical protein
LIRLWVLHSAIWVCGVVLAAVYDPDLGVANLTRAVFHDGDPAKQAPTVPDWTKETVPGATEKPDGTGFHRDGQSRSGASGSDLRVSARVEMPLKVLLETMSTSLHMNSDLSLDVSNCDRICQTISENQGYEKWADLPADEGVDSQPLRDASHSF